MSHVIDRKPVDKWIPWLVVLFFMVFMCVDAVMVTLAITTQTGLVTEEAYEKGLDYNKTIAAAAAQAKLGWKDKISLEGNILSYSLKDKTGNFPAGADVRAKISRPTQDGYDFEIPLHKISTSTYETEVSFPLPGTWNVRIFVKWPDQQYQSSQTVLAP